jgi:hypothetical protein
MRINTGSITLTFAALAFAACTALIDGELDEKPSPPDAGDAFCRGLEDGTDCSTPESPNHVCVGFRCVPRGCGDGLVEGDEVCDPPDGVSCCDGCQICCQIDADCDDGDPCNGDEECTDDYACVPSSGLLPAEGAACERLVGDLVVAGFCCDTVCSEQCSP